MYKIIIIQDGPCKNNLFIQMKTAFYDVHETEYKGKTRPDTAYWLTRNCQTNERSDIDYKEKNLETNY